MEFRETGNFNEDNFTGENKTDSRMENTPVRVLTAKTIIGDKVENGKGEKLGVIEDIMLNMGTGCTEYVVVSFGGFMGVGEKYFAIPWMNLRLDEEGRKFVLNYEKKVFENAPGFDKHHWPKSNTDHFNHVKKYWADQL
jgi:sporulation protein YlmC with PRC-barrel domain